MSIYYAYPTEQTVMNCKAYKAVIKIEQVVRWSQISLPTVQKPAYSKLCMNVVLLKFSDESIIPDQITNQIFNIGLDGSNIVLDYRDSHDSRFESSSIVDNSNYPISVLFLFG